MKIDYLDEVCTIDSPTVEEYPMMLEAFHYFKEYFNTENIPMNSYGRFIIDDETYQIIPKETYDKITWEKEEDKALDIIKEINYAYSGINSFIDFNDILAYVKDHFDICADDYIMGNLRLSINDCYIYNIRISL